MNEAPLRQPAGGRHARFRARRLGGLGRILSLPQGVELADCPVPNRGGGTVCIETRGEINYALSKTKPFKRALLRVVEELNTSFETGFKNADTSPTELVNLKNGLRQILENAARALHSMTQ